MSENPTPEQVAEALRKLVIVAHAGRDKSVPASEVEEWATLVRAALAAETTETEYRVTGTDRAGIGAVSDWMPTWHEARGYYVTWKRYGITDLAIESRTVTTTTTVTPWTEQKQ